MGEGHVRGQSWWHGCLSQAAFVCGLQCIHTWALLFAGMMARAHTLGLHLSLGCGWFCYISAVGDKGGGGGAGASFYK